MRSLIWSTGYDALLTRLVKEGLSLAQLEAEMKLPREMISRRIDYLGLKPPEVLDAFAIEKKNAATMKKARQLLRFRGCSESHLHGMPREAQLEAANLILKAQRKPLLRLEHP